MVRPAFQGVQVFHVPEGRGAGRKGCTESRGLLHDQVVGCGVQLHQLRHIDRK